jgi:2,4-didehydro-3-deoxy-L-rhamnonate hydrolase
LLQAPVCELRTGSVVLLELGLPRSRLSQTGLDGYVRLYIDSVICNVDPVMHNRSAWRALMRLANHDNRLVIVTSSDTHGVPVTGQDVESASDGRFSADPQAVYERWSDFTSWAESMPNGADQVKLRADLLGSPAPRPRQVFGIALNYVAHAREAKMELPATPPTFTKFPTSLTGPFTDVDLPSSTVDWEVELVVVVGTRAEHLAEADAWRCVAGLTVGQDLSDREVQMAGAPPQFSLGKSFPGFGPMGPALVTPDELDDPDDLALTTRIGNEVMQEGRTSQMIFSVGALIQRLSRVLPLLPGDVIFTGTPSGIGAARTPPRFLHPGETLVSEISGLGQMRNTFRLRRP